MTTSTCASTSMLPCQHSRQPACAPTGMRTNHAVAAGRAAVRSVRFRLFLVTCLFAFSPTLLHAQIDLCSFPNGIVLEAGVNHSVLVKVPAGTFIWMKVERECDPERDFMSNNGLFLTGSNWWDATTWDTGPGNQNPSSLNFEHVFKEVKDAMEIQIELDACEGTRVRVKCT